MPPAAPTTILTSPSDDTIMLGHIEDKGRFHGAIKLAGDAGTPKKFVVFGVEKSSISLLKIIPVLEPTTLDPKLNIKKRKKKHLFKLHEFKILRLENSDIGYI